MSDWQAGYRRAILDFIRAPEDADADSVELRYDETIDYGGDTGVQYPSMKARWIDAAGKQHETYLGEDDIARLVQTFNGPLRGSERSES